MEAELHGVGEAEFESTSTKLRVVGTGMAVEEAELHGVGEAELESTSTKLHVVGTGMAVGEVELHGVGEAELNGAGEVEFEATSTIHEIESLSQSEIELLHLSVTKSGGSGTISEKNTVKRDMLLSSPLVSLILLNGRPTGLPIQRLSLFLAI